MIIIPALVPTRDLVMRVAALQPGRVVRAREVASAPGGKPLNVARLLEDAGTAVHLVAVESDRARLDVSLVEDDGRLTVINAPLLVDSGEVDLALDDVEASVSSGDVLVVAGRQPPGAFARLVEIARGRRVRLAVDTSGADLRAALDSRPWLLKVNADELAEATGASPDDAWQRAGGRIGAAEIMVVTHGPAGARMFCQGESLEALPPLVRQVNPLGAGDALLAGMLAELEAGADHQLALRTGVAWAASLVTSTELSVDLSAIDSVRDRVEVRPLEGG